MENDNKKMLANLINNLKLIGFDYIKEYDSDEKLIIDEDIFQLYKDAAYLLKRAEDKYDILKKDNDEKN